MAKIYLIKIGAHVWAVEHCTDNRQNTILKIPLLDLRDLKTNISAKISTTTF